MTSFTQSLEDKANQIIKSSSKDEWNNSIPAILKREIAFTINQIDRLRDFQKHQLSELDRTKRDVGTELLQMEDRTPRYSPRRYPEREKLQRQLVGLKGERRRQDVFYEEKLQALQKNLLGMIHRYEQISNMSNDS